VQRIEIRGCLPTLLVGLLLAAVVGLALTFGAVAIAAGAVIGALAAVVGAVRQRLRRGPPTPRVTVDAEGPVVDVEVRERPAGAGDGPGRLGERGEDR
jgi:hypothetical protein